MDVVDDPFMASQHYPQMESNLPTHINQHDIDGDSPSITNNQKNTQSQTPPHKPLAENTEKIIENTNKDCDINSEKQGNCDSPVAQNPLYCDASIAKGHAGENPVSDVNSPVQERESPVQEGESPVKEGESPVEDLKTQNKGTVGENDITNTNNKDEYYLAPVAQNPNYYLTVVGQNDSTQSTTTPNGAGENVDNKEPDDYIVPVPPDSIHCPDCQSQSKDGGHTGQQCTKDDGKTNIYYTGGEPKTEDGSNGGEGNEYYVAPTAAQEPPYGKLDKKKMGHESIYTPLVKGDTLGQRFRAGKDSDPATILEAPTRRSGEGQGYHDITKESYPSSNKEESICMYGPFPDDLPAANVHQDNLDDNSDPKSKTANLNAAAAGATSKMLNNAPRKSMKPVSDCKAPDTNPYADMTQGSEWYHAQHNPIEKEELIPLNRTRSLPPLPPEANIYDSIGEVRSKDGVLILRSDPEDGNLNPGAFGRMDGEPVIRKRRPRWVLYLCVSIIALGVIVIICTSAILLTGSGQSPTPSPRHAIYSGCYLDHYYPEASFSSGSFHNLSVLATDQWADVSCPYGYRATTTTVHCTNRRLQEDPPFCKPKVCNLPTPNVSYYTTKGSKTSRLKHGENATVYCNHGYTQTHGHVTCVDGQPTPAPPYCRLDEPSACSMELRPTDYAQFISTSKVAEGDEREFRCNETYYFFTAKTMVKTAWTTCTRGNWQPLPQCVLPSSGCPMEEVQEGQGTVQQDWFQVDNEETCKYLCTHDAECRYALFETSTTGMSALRPYCKKYTSDTPASIEKGINKLFKKMC